METRHAAYSLACKTGAIFGGHFGGKNPRLIAEEIRYVHEVLVNRLALSLPRKSVVRLTDCPNMTIAVYVKQQYNNY